MNADDDRPDDGMRDHRANEMKDLVLSSSLNKHKAGGTRKQRVDCICRTPDFQSVTDVHRAGKQVKEETTDLFPELVA